MHVHNLEQLHCSDATCRERAVGYCADAPFQQGLGPLCGTHLLEHQRQRHDVRFVDGGVCSVCEGHGQVPSQGAELETPGGRWIRCPHCQGSGYASEQVLDAQRRRAAGPRQQKSERAQAESRAGQEARWAEANRRREEETQRSKERADQQREANEARRREKNRRAAEEARHRAEERAKPPKKKQDGGLLGGGGRKTTNGTQLVRTSLARPAGVLGVFLRDSITHLAFP